MLINPYLASPDFHLQAIFTREPLRPEYQQHNQANPDDDNADSGELVGIEHWDQVLDKARALEQYHHDRSPSDCAVVGAAPARNYRHERISDHDVGKLRRIDVLI